jgi:hypothetical protein
MVNGIERSRVRGNSQPEPWVPFNGNGYGYGWAYPLGPSWPRSYGIVRTTRPDEIELSLEKEGLLSPYRLLSPTQ